MSDAAILFVKPNAIKPRDRRALQAAGVIVVEVDDPHAARFVKAEVEMPAGTILKAAAKAIGTSGTAKDAFATALTAAIALLPDKK